MKPVTDISAADLPFLIEHGGWVWKVLLVVLIVSTIASAWLFTRRRRYAKRARRMASHAGLATMHALTSVEGVVRGTAMTVVQGDTSRSESSRGIHLVTDAGVRLELVGPVFVHSGYDNASHSWLSRDVPQRLRDGLDVMAATTLRRIYDGDRVLVAGHLSANGVEARPDAPLLITAVPPMTKRWPTLVWTGVVGLVVGTMWAYILQDVGDRALKHVGNDVRLREWASQIAAAMPGSREKLLAAADDYAPFGRHSELWVRDRIALAEMRGECPDKILMYAYRPVEALAAARRCAPRRLAGPMLLLGMYDEAAALDPRTMTPAAWMVSALATGHWNEAAAEVDSMLGNQKSTEVRERLECFAALLRSYAGDAGAFDALHARTSGECRLFTVLSRPINEWKAGLASLELPDDLHVAHDLWVASGGHQSYVNDDVIVSLPTALAQYSTGRLASVFRGRQATVLGDYNAAALEFQRARSEGLETYDLYIAETELAYRSGRPGTAPRGSREKLDYRFDRVLKTYLDDCASTAVTIGLARGGDARLFASAVENCRGDSAIAMAETAGGVTVGREELAQAIRWSKDDELRFGIQFPFDLTHNLSWFRDIARLLGDDEEADALQAMVVRHMRVLGDPQRAVALYFWADWTWSWPMW